MARAEGTTASGVRNVVVGGWVEIGDGQPLAVIGGPCVIESEGFTLHMAAEIRDRCQAHGFNFIFKSSFDKANRSSASSFRGPTFDEGLAILTTVRENTGVPTLTDIHESWQAAPVAEVVDVLQIPAFLCRQTDLLVAAARTGRVVNIKKGQFLSPPEMENAVAKVEAEGNDQILLTERGTSFGYNNLVVDFRSLPQMRALGHPVVFDATHSVQMPGALGGASGGQREFVPHLARAAVAVGVDAVFMEIHEEPERALSDGPTMVRLDRLSEILADIAAIRNAAERARTGVVEQAQAPT